MSYKQEATTRIAYLSVAFVVSVVVGSIIGLIVYKAFPGTNHNTNNKLAIYSGLVIFALVCALLVYKVDEKLNKRFNDNP